MTRTTKKATRKARLTMRVLKLMEEFGDLRFTDRDEWVIIRNLGNMNPTDEEVRKEIEIYYNN